MAICYGVISYAAYYASEGREAAFGQTREETTRPSETVREETTAAPAEEEKKTATIRVTNTSGEPFGVNYGNLDSSKTVEGNAPTEYQVQVRTGRSTGDYATATVWKNTGDLKNDLKVQILVDGKVVREASTKDEDYGATSVRWGPYEPTPPPSTNATTSQVTTVR